MWGRHLIMLHPWRQCLTFPWHIKSSCPLSIGGFLFSINVFFPRKGKVNENSPHRKSCFLIYKNAASVHFLLFRVGIQNASSACLTSSWIDNKLENGNSVSRLTFLDFNYLSYFLLDRCLHADTNGIQLSLKILNIRTFCQ